MKLANNFWKVVWTPFGITVLIWQSDSLLQKWNVYGKITYFEDWFCEDIWSVSCFIYIFEDFSERLAIAVALFQFISLNNLSAK